MKILIAEDQAPAALYLRRTLERMGHRPAVAPDGEAAWEMLERDGADVLISDWMMPRLDGLGLCRRIRAVEHDRYTYVILLTARNNRDDRLEGLHAGADDFLTKPPDPDELNLRLQIAGRILAVHAELGRRNARLAELATTDALTGVRNRRRFHEDLDLLLSQARRLREPLSLVMLDVDNFKSFNDSFGHPAGDEVLRRVGAMLQSSVRGHDLVARYGGEEFAVLLPATGTEEAVLVSERLRSAFRSEAWPHRPVTASLGLDTAGPVEFQGADDLIRRADEALYRSKREGRDRVSAFTDRLAGPAPSPPADALPSPPSLAL
ncbi:diguanylate cyclase [Tautonia plasticadhaerens]|uniref:diguanylate cyclase n=1 Tax=Tautonia plasticadhaerens TaxID=2527974 RepID=A0A518HC61_9BACT|nr:diguanylate cyclase [Tautonia plasticadhaerens]QDV38429.1 Response regulator PleD [Tautonia plasticadhaerens]